MPTFRYAKLVRDNTPGWHRDNGHTVSGRQLTGDELRAALVEKLHEEADEVSGALGRDELIEEIGDVQQIIHDLCKSQNISDEELKETIKKKTERKGGFTAGEYIDTVAIPNEEDKWALYCRQSPEKYPEVKE
jgi:predicted house-cleaning noncanonical NTP pyrophosphatase (MazG superfamily)